MTTKASASRRKPAARMVRRRGLGAGTGLEAASGKELRPKLYSARQRFSIEGPSQVVLQSECKYSRCVIPTPRAFASGARDLPGTPHLGKGDPSLRLKNGFVQDDALERGSSRFQTEALPLPDSDSSLIGESQDLTLHTVPSDVLASVRRTVGW